MQGIIDAHTSKYYSESVESTYTFCKENYIFEDILQTAKLSHLRHLGTARDIYACTHPVSRPFICMCVPAIFCGCKNFGSRPKRTNKRDQTVPNWRHRVDPLSVDSTLPSLSMGHIRKAQIELGLVYLRPPWNASSLS